MKTGIETGRLLTIDLQRLADSDSDDLPDTMFLGENGQGRFLIEQPILKTVPYPLLNGEACECSYSDESAVYIVPCKVHNRIPRGGEILYAMIQTGELERVQRRDNFRLPISLEGHMRAQSEAGYDIIDDPFETVDISGGGMALMTSHELDKTEDCEVKIALEPGHPLTIQAEICWRRNVVDEKVVKRWKYIYGLKFSEENSKQREYLAHFIFHKQIQQRRRAR